MDLSSSQTIMSNLHMNAGQFSHLYQLALHQNATWATIDIVFASVAILVFAIGLILLHKHSGERDNDGYCAFFVFTCILLAIGIPCLVCGIDRLQNPDMNAMQSIMSLVSHK